MAFCLWASAGLVAVGAEQVGCGSSNIQADDGGGVDVTVDSISDDAKSDGGNGGDGQQAHDAAFDGGRESASDTDAGDDGSMSAIDCDGRAPLPPDAELPPVHLCSFSDGGAEFPVFDKCCASSDDCAIGRYEFSCCGDQLALGFNKSQAPAFAATVAQWTCAACGCAGQGLHTEDGEGGVLDAGVKCENGYCVTYAR